VDPAPKDPAAEEPALEEPALEELALEEPVAEGAPAEADEAGPADLELPLLHAAALATAPSIPRVHSRGRERTGTGTP
jgi:hypothetical protein